MTASQTSCRPHLPRWAGMPGVGHVALVHPLHPESKSEIEMWLQSLSVLPSPFTGHLDRQVQMKLQCSPVRFTNLDNEETMDCIYPTARAGSLILVAPIYTSVWLQDVLIFFVHTSITWLKLLVWNLFAYSYQRAIISLSWMYTTIASRRLLPFPWKSLPFYLFHFFFPCFKLLSCIPKTLWFIELCSSVMPPLIPPHTTYKLFFRKAQDRGMAGTPFHLLWKVVKVLQQQMLILFCQGS